MIIWLGLLLVQAQVPLITARPVTAPPEFSRPKYTVQCELRDLDFRKSYRLALTQYGGIYTHVDGFGARSPTYVRFSRDDMGIFGPEEQDMTGSRITDWYSDGPIELIAKSGRGGITFEKTAKPQAFLQSPTKVAVTVKGAHRVRGAQGDTSWQDLLLVGACDVAWETQSVAPRRNAN